MSHKSVMDNNLDKNILDLKKFADFKYQPNEIDFSKNATLNEFDLEYIFTGEELKNQDSLRNEIANILLLKQYLFHLSNHNQGFDLLSMRKGQAKFVIDYFLSKHNIDMDAEMVNSGLPYEILKGDSIQSKQVQELCRKIVEESNRVLRME